MRLTAPRYGHITNGKLYLAHKEDRPTAIKSYVSLIREAYGSLHGVQVVEVKVGTPLTLLRDGTAYVVPYHTDYCKINVKNLGVLL